jgi:hypothetical protein
MLAMLATEWLTLDVKNLTDLLREDLIVKFIAFIILLAGFLIGVIIGWIYGKIKSKKVEKLV